MNNKKYVIVSAPNATVLEMLVEAYIEQGMEPTGGITIDDTENGKVFMQALWQKSNEQPVEDWSTGMVQNTF